MSSKELFQRFARLCQKWPKDESKLGRDLGEAFRQELNEHFTHGDLGQVKNPERVRAILEPLERLVDNQYFDENPLKRSSASGLDLGVLGDVISNEGLKVMQDQDEGSIINRLKSSLSMRFTDSLFEQKPVKQITSHEEMKDSNRKESST